MEQLIIQYITRFITPFVQKFKKHLLLSLLFILYLFAFWFLFFTKGIYVDGHFYRKSANLTTITYTCKSPFADFKSIRLEKQLNSSVITIDDSCVMTVNSDGIVSLEKGAFTEETLPHAQWDRIADQSAEQNRGFGTKPWVLVLLLFAAVSLIKRYSTEVYTFLRRNRAAGEGYYKAVDIAFRLVWIAGLVYLIIPL